MRDYGPVLFPVNKLVNTLIL